MGEWLHFHMASRDAQRVPIEGWFWRILSAANWEIFPKHGPEKSSCIHNLAIHYFQKKIFVHTFFSWGDCIGNVYMK